MLVAHMSLDTALRMTCGVSMTNDFTVSSLLISVRSMIPLKPTGLGLKKMRLNTAEVSAGISSIAFLVSMSWTILSSANCFSEPGW